MAINPITSDFVAGAVLTAAQMNRFPRGVIGFNTAAPALVTLTTANTTFCTVTFTIPSTRQIQFVGNFPLIDNPAGTQLISADIFQGLTKVANTQLSVGSGESAENVTIIRSYALAAGTYTYTLQASVSTGTNRSNSSAAGGVTLVSLTAIDLGPA